MGAIDDSTPVVTSVRDEQLLPGGAIPASKMLPWDVPVDIICTPTQVCVRVRGRGVGGLGVCASKMALCGGSLYTFTHPGPSALGGVHALVGWPGIH